ncbi:MAG: hypothetical protein HC854_10035 [Flavobacterium sp.]|nr:hypothetical protein [Flavobacterium sp.]
MENIQYWCRILGLIFDIIGIVMLFYNGLPFNPDVLDSYVEIEILESEKPKLNRQKKLSFISLFILIIGFVLQLIGSF